MSHDCTILGDRGNVWNWNTLTIGIFDWLQAEPRPRRGPVKVQLHAKLSQEGIDRSKIMAARIIQALDNGTYTGPKVVKLF